MSLENHLEERDVIAKPSASGAESSIQSTRTSSHATIASINAPRESLVSISAELPPVSNEGVILRTQLNAFIPSVFPKKSEYISMIIDETTVQPPSSAGSCISLQSSCLESSSLLGQPPLDYLWKVFRILIMGSYKI